MGLILQRNKFTASYYFFLRKKAFFLLLLIITLCFSQKSIAQSFADKWEFVGVAVEEPGYTIWGSSPVETPDGKVHLFVSRWPCELKVNPGWRSHSEIAHYVGDSPEGPFEFSDISLKGSGEETWDKFGMHNPNIHFIDGQFVLLYIGNNDPKRPIHPSNQKIGMATADSSYGPWKKVGKKGLVLDTPLDRIYWNYKASNGVNNPALLKHPQGGFVLYFKSEQGRMGAAISQKLIGPYVQLPFPTTDNDRAIEDGYAFILNDQIALLTTDNHGIMENGGGILWKSKNGIYFNEYEKGFHRINQYTSINMEEVAVHYGPTDRKYAKFERPQLLLRNGKPAYFYVASGTNIYGGPCTVSYVLKYNKK